MRVDARDVLDTNAKTKRTFRARIIGHFRRSGPNAWDDYQYVSDDEAVEIEVSPTLDVQVEAWGVELRFRRLGRVVRLRWLPDAEDEPLIRGLSPQKLREYFLGNYLETFDEALGMGAAAVIASKLS